MNGKTIGRTKPEPDRSKVDESVRIFESVGDGLNYADAEQAGVRPSETERELKARLVLLGRRLEQSEARNAVLINGGDRSNLSRPVGNAFDWMREFTERMLAIGDMNEKARKREFDKMLADVKAVEDRKKKHAADVELDAADWAAKRKRGEGPDE